MKCFRYPAGVAAVALAAVCIAQRPSVDSPQLRVSQTTRFLASDDLEGRGVGTRGIELAAQFIAQRFAEIGLEDLAPSPGGPFDYFEIVTDTRLGEANTLVFSGPQGDRQAARVDADYRPLAIGGTGEIDLPIAFAGYGITAQEADYDDYAGLNAAGKAVVLLRHEPRQDDPQSPLNGADDSVHAPFLKKAALAQQQGAAAVIFTTDPHEAKKRVEQWDQRIAKLDAEIEASRSADAARGAPTRLLRRRQQYESRRAEELDPLLDFTRAGEAAGCDIPLLYVRPSVIDQWLDAALPPNAQPRTLRALEALIDATGRPLSFELPGSRIAGRVAIDRETSRAANVLGRLRGAGPHADEVIVVGAHYDHVGLGGQGSKAPGSRAIHNGADDNASGIAALLEVARTLAERPQPPPRTIVFAAFAGEERGLLGSADYVADPPVPLERTVAMLNFDMVGRLRDNKLIVNGTASARQFDGWIDAANTRVGLDIAKIPDALGPSDHASFARQRVPVLHLFTGFHDEYHRPDDDFPLLNIEGIVRVAALAVGLVDEIAAAERPEFQEVDK
ncbi:Aminopeptidase YwaD precursor [Pirellulimonas nuda]|uniref:Aminopeptidase YwaD n=1 Tax=Pirellulimonas nuda TaxID=2528009 RepID=A0A518DF19_9BACT|nr:M20/M25/M40 family metallo-hydrolase [Pirellulimonas nuda]QDU90085.1 Aminopeptidase YwaD precursor [Pirellulimonas nuda]